jgi:hypothetical protein
MIAATRPSPVQSKTGFTNSGTAMQCVNWGQPKYSALLAAKLNRRIQAGFQSKNRKTEQTLSHQLALIVRGQFTALSMQLILLN